MTAETFTVTTVDEFFSVADGLVMIQAGDMMMPITTEDYAEAKRLIGKAEGIDPQAVSLVGRTLMLDDEGIPVLPD